MILGKEEFERIKELQHSEELLYKCVQYLEREFERYDSTMVEQSFKGVGFSKEDLIRLGVSSDIEEE